MGSTLVQTHQLFQPGVAYLRAPQVESESMFRVRQAAQYSFLPWTEIEGRQFALLVTFVAESQGKAVRF